MNIYRNVNADEISPSEMIRHFRNGGRDMVRWLRAVLTPLGHEVYQELTQRQRRMLREAIYMSWFNDGKVVHTLKHGHSKKIINALVDWGALEGKWAGCRWKGHLVDGIVREVPTLQPPDLPDRRIVETYKQLEIPLENSYSESGVCEDLPKVVTLQVTAGTVINIQAVA